MRSPIAYERLLAASAGAVLLLAAGGPARASDPETTCVSAKNRASGTFAVCLQKAYSRFARRGSADRLSKDLTRCETRFGHRWQAAESTAAKKGTACITENDEARIRSGVSAHAACVANALESGDASCLRGTASGPLEESWDGFVTALIAAGEFTKGHPFYDTPQARAEGLRRVLRGVVHAIQDGFDDKDFPVFTRRPDHLTRGALDNPDNTYYTARIRDDRDYRIRGTRGTTASLVFQSLAGSPGVGTSGPSDGIDILDASDMTIAPDGSFEIIVSRDPKPGNWLRIEEGAETILVRFSHSDWDTEVAGKVHITQVGNEGATTPDLTEARVGEILDRASEVLVDTTAFWPALVQDRILTLPANIPIGPLNTADGLDTQFFVTANYDLADEEALIITAPPSAAEYQGIQLGHFWFESLEYAHRQTSLTTAQSHLGSDGVYRYVITKNDPGVPNWLDTEGHAQGIFFMRWQGLDTAPAPVTATVVPFSQVLAQYPGDVPMVDSEQRRQQIEARQIHVQDRYGQ